MRLSMGCLVGSLALLLFGCGRGCGCIPGERTYESLDGPVRLELVRHVHEVIGHLPGLRTSFAVRVHVDPPFDEYVDCSHVDLAEDESGRHVAFRCRGERRWTVLRLLGGDRRVRECRAPVGRGARPAFDGLESLSRSIDRVLDCPGGRAAPEVWASYVRAVAEVEGQEPAVAVVLAMAARALPERADHPDVWPHALDALEPPARAAALGRVCAALTRTDTPAALYVRAASRCPLDTPGVAIGARGWIGRVLEPRALRTPLPPSSVAATAWASAIVARAMPTNSSESARVACDAMRVFDRFADADPRLQAAALILAQSSTTCDALVKWSDPPLCVSTLDCGDALCSADELRVERQSWFVFLDAPLGTDGTRPLVEHLAVPRLLLGALYTNGELPRELAVRNARRHYARPPPGAPDCTSGLPAGTECTCPRAHRGYVFCNVPVDQTSATDGSCSYELDDATRRIVRVTSACETSGRDCDMDRVCCPGLVCVPGPHAACVPE